MKSIRLKMIVYVSILVLVVVSSMGVLSAITAGNLIIDEVEMSLETQAGEVGELIASELQGYFNILETYASSPVIVEMNYDEQRPLMVTQRERSDFIGIGVVSPDGTTRYADGDTAELGDRDYVIRAFEGETNVSNVIISRVTGGPVVMMATPIYRGSTVAGVMVGRLDGDFLSDLIDDKGYGDVGHAYILSADGTTQAHRERDNVLNQINLIERGEEDPDFAVVSENAQIMVTEDRGVVNYDFQGQSLYAGFGPVSGTAWTVVVTADRDEILGALGRLQQNMLLMGIGFLLVGIIAAAFLGNSFTKPIIAVKDQLTQMANFDLRQSESTEAQKYVNRKDEVGDMLRASGEMQVNMISLVKEIAGAAENVAASSEELTATSAESSKASDEVAKSVEDMAKGAGEQAKDTEAGAAHINELGKIIENDQGFMRELNSEIENVDHYQATGHEAMIELVSVTQKSKASTEEVKRVIEETKDSTGKIEEASGMIRNIAEQTNLLALNAAIEAARAGEAGRGFAVVAEEIRKLAEESNSFTSEIASIVDELGQKVGKAVAAMNEVQEIADTQESQVKKTNEDFDEIENSIMKMKEKVKDLNGSGKEMEDKKEEIIRIIENLSAISEENAASTEEVSASVEEQTAAMVEIANSSEGLAKLAEDMNEALRKFKF
ncbi:MAG: methyl-accepting chemotaxis protein [Tindallia sp. MSAO_Bac2]|nr:MAG: methyl-accepting chemotaxis protein [Tindallia sp. MSAO_Bac2]